MAIERVYYADQELPDLPIDWADADGNPYDFSSGWTFQATLHRIGDAAATTLALKTSGFTGAATFPNLVVSWASTDFAGLETSPTRGVPYIVNIRARRTADSKDMYWSAEEPEIIRLKTAPGTSVTPPSSTPIGVVASLVSVTPTGALAATNAQAAFAELDSDLTAHLNDTVDAHDASAISVLDTAGYYTGPTKTAETALAEAGLARLRDLLQPIKVAPIKVMSSPPTVSALATVTAIASAVTLTTSSNASTNPNTAFFTTNVGSDWSRLGETFPNYQYVTQVSPTVGGGSTYGRIEFDYYGTAFEINGKGNGGKIRIWVDGELVSATPTTFTNDGNVYFLPVTFSSTGHRRIAIDHYNFSFGGITIGPNDTVTPVDTRRPKVLLIGDSFVEGTGANNCDGFAVALGQSLDWDVWAAGQGGSGYSAPGSYTGKYSTRLSFYSSIDFDVVITSGGINDANATYISSLAADAASLFTSIKSTWPTAAWVCTSPLINKGVEGWASQYHTARATLKAAAAAAGFFFADLMEMPIVGSTPVTGTLQNSPAGGATTISSSVRVANRSTIEIGTGLSTVERRVVTNTSGTGPYTLTVAALTNAHTAGETVKQVGNCLWTGTGRVGATTGSGNCDLFVSSDSTHPSVAGHLAIGRTMAALIASAMQPY